METRPPSDKFILKDYLRRLAILAKLKIKSEPFKKDILQ